MKNLEEILITLELSLDKKDCIQNIGAKRGSKRKGYYYFVITDDNNFYAFDELGNLKCNIEITSIRPYDFFFNNKLKTIVFPKSIKNISSNAFSYCYNLQNVTIPKETKSIGSWAFNQCLNLKSVLFRERTMDQVLKMKGYPFGIRNTSIIQSEF